MDDPIFDPWPIEAGTASEARSRELSPPEGASPLPPPGPPLTTHRHAPTAPPRWRSSTVRDVPAGSPISASTARQEEPGTDERSSPPAVGIDDLPLRPPAPPAPQASLPGAEAEPSHREPAAHARAATPSTPTPAPSAGEPTPVAERLRDLAIPRLEELAVRLESARHGTLLDDRSHRAESGLRFRLMPWQGPFDGATAVPGSVLELLVDETDDSHVVARFWLDPLEPEPAEERRIAAGRLGGVWLDGVLMDFVERALSIV